MATQVIVRPKLGELLRGRAMRVPDLQRELSQRLGLTVDIKTLYRLTHANPVQRVDLPLVAAIAHVLGICLGDLFDVELVPQVQISSGMTPEQEQRMVDLFTARSNQPLSAAEDRELDQLVAAYTRGRYECYLKIAAEQRGRSVEEMDREVRAAVERAAQEWRELEPQLMRYVDSEDDVTDHITQRESARA